MWGGGIPRENHRASVRLNTSSTTRRAVWDSIVVSDRPLIGFRETIDWFQWDHWLVSVRPLIGFRETIDWLVSERPLIGFRDHWLVSVRPLIGFRETIGWFQRDHWLVSDRPLISFREIIDWFQTDHWLVSDRPLIAFTIIVDNHAILQNYGWIESTWTLIWHSQKSMLRWWKVMCILLCNYVVQLIFIDQNIKLEINFVNYWISKCFVKRVIIRTTNLSPKKKCYSSSLT